MKDKVAPPRFQVSPDQFDPALFNDFQRRLVIFLNEMLSQGHCDIATLKLTSLPTSASGERDDTVFVDNGYLKLVGSSQAGHRKAGSLTILDTNTTIDITFATAFPDNDYAVTLGFTSDARIWITSKSATGFTINRVGSSGALEVFWIAMPYSDL